MKTNNLRDLGKEENPICKTCGNEYDIRMISLTGENCQSCYEDEEFKIARLKQTGYRITHYP